MWIGWTEYAPSQTKPPHTHIIYSYYIIRVSREYIDGDEYIASSSSLLNNKLNFVFDIDFVIFMQFGMCFQNLVVNKLGPQFSILHNPIIGSILATDKDVFYTKDF